MCLGILVNEGELALSFKENPVSHHQQTTQRQSFQNPNTSVDTQLVPSTHRSLFRGMRNNDSGSEDDSKDRPPKKYEPQVIRPSPSQRNPSFFGFKNVLEDVELRGLSDPRLSLFNYNPTPRFIPTDSDPRQLSKSIFQREMFKNNSLSKNIFLNRDERNLSNNSNISHSFMFNNFDMTPGSNKTIKNISRPTDYNFEALSILQANKSNGVPNMLNTQNTPFYIPEKEKNLLVNLVVQPSSMTQRLSTPLPSNINLASNTRPFNLYAEKGKKYVLEVLDDNTISIRNLDSP